KILTTLYLLGEKGASHLSGELVDAACEFLPLDRLQHGDLWLGNMLIPNGNGAADFVLFDWEAAGAGHPWLDWIRTLAVEAGVTDPRDLPRLVDWLRELPSRDQWTAELFPNAIPSQVMLLAASFALVSES